MPHSRYFIVQTADGWVIRFADADFGPYQTRHEALIFAAQRLGAERGENAEMCLLGENGHFRPEWTFDRDRYLVGKTAPDDLCRGRGSRSSDASDSRRAAASVRNGRRAYTFPVIAGMAAEAVRTQPGRMPREIT